MAKNGDNVFTYQIYVYQVQIENIKSLFNQ